MCRDQSRCLGRVSTTALVKVHQQHRCPVGSTDLPKGPKEMSLNKFWSNMLFVRFDSIGPFVDCFFCTTTRLLYMLSLLALLSATTTASIAATRFVLSASLWC